MTRRSLGELERLVMLAILALGEQAYGASIRREIESRTGRDIAVGAIYTALDRLEKRDAVVSHIGGPTAERGGRRRKHYALQPAGAADLHHSLQMLHDMTHGMDALLESLPEAGER